MNNRKVFLIVLDSLGIGAMPDAADFNDAGANTLKRISGSKYFNIPTLKCLGIGNIDGQEYLGAVGAPLAAHARMCESSRGKDTTIGHWEIAGIISHTPLPTYPDGFPDEIINEFEKLAGRKILCNKPYSGTEVIRDYGCEHIESGALIVYTSADSVFQIAAHEDIIAPEKLYEYCRVARKLLCGKHAVGRVIARPFIGKYPDFKRTANRHDFSLEPTSKTMLDAIKSSGGDVIAVGKITDIFAGCGITETILSKSNDEGMRLTHELLKRDFNGLCFTNLVDFDSVYGHRNDIDGYAKALSDADKQISCFIEAMSENDILFITADHGCDPGDASTDHTREYTPLLIYGKDIKPVNLSTRPAFADIAATICDILGVDFKTAGKSFAANILKR
ncbi:MAG: phosphopentomutase [Ruminococcaceae bacterium]|nr:phosphopentomutase [Oscillospiraceae bacterium]